jgi:hypothetical protein
VRPDRNDQVIEELNCKSVRGALWDFAAGTLDGTDNLLVSMHLRDCRECMLHKAEVRSLRTGLKSLPELGLSPMLQTRLKVVASRERSRQMLRRDLAARFNEFKSTAKLIFDNLLKPIAVPAVGGLLASFLCFGVIVDTLHVHAPWENDIPAGLFTQVAIDDFSPFSVNGKDVIVQLTVDRNGTVSDFEVPQSNQVSDDELKEIGNLVLYSSFTPATAFGQRVTGKILVSIHHINIRG